MILLPFPHIPTLIPFISIISTLIPRIPIIAPISFPIPQSGIFK